MPLGKASLEWRSGVPVSNQFDDVYFDASNGLDESRFVFLHGADIEKRLSISDQLTIGETGFGTGLNFLATWQLLETLNSDTRLTYVSFEGFPMTDKQMKHSHDCFPELSRYASLLRENLPPPQKGVHLRTLHEGRVRLILVYDQILAGLQSFRGKIDAWYLDGFAPAKNPEMWSTDVLSQVARHSHMGASLATFTASGSVRRGLEKAGFNVKKTPGYGKKRERLVATFEKPCQSYNNQSSTGQSSTGQSSTDQPSTGQPSTGQSSTGQPSTGQSSTGQPYKGTEHRTLPSVTIIGAGIAGAMAARTFADHGYRITLIKSAESPGHEDLPAAVIAPGFKLGDDAACEFSHIAFAHAVSHPLIRAQFLSPKGIRITFDKGAERLQRLKSALNWGKDWLEFEPDSIFCPRSGALIPAKLIACLVKDIPTHQAHINRITRQKEHWHLTSKDGQTFKSDIVVIASAQLLERIAPGSYLELRPRGGQVDTIEIECANAKIQQESLIKETYLTPALDSQTNIRVCGSTVERLSSFNSQRTISKQAATDQNLAKLSHMLSDMFSSGEATIQTVADWYGVRATTPDHLPYVGPILSADSDETNHIITNTKNTPGAKAIWPLFALTGFGSKGYQYAPLCAEVLASYITGEPSPVSNRVFNALSTRRMGKLQT